MNEIKNGYGSNFSLQLKLNAVEISRLNNMYFKNLFKERVRIFSVVILVFSIFYDLNNDTDLILWLIRDLILIVLFLIFQYSFVNTVCKVIFHVIKRLLKFEKFIAKYKVNFTYSLICVRSPLGEFTHKWTQIEKAILTRDFFFLYVKERNGYIISIANKYSNERDLEKLVAFVESNVIHVVKV